MLAFVRHYWCLIYVLYRIHPIHDSYADLIALTVAPTLLTNMSEPAVKRVKLDKEASEELAKLSGFDDFMSEFELALFVPAPGSALDDEIETAILKCEEMGNAVSTEVPEVQNNATVQDCNSSSSPDEKSPFSIFENEQAGTSVTSPGEDEEKRAPVPTACDMGTVATLKKAMAGNSRLVGSFTALKVTYLKLCKEFNFLLGKFNDNERVKIELIHENNELRKLLVDVIKERELDRKKYKEDILALQGKINDVVLH